MLTGHLDEVAPTHVKGWAANISDPDGIVPVSIFVDGWKVAQIECSQYRSDLQKKGFGEGRHGFRYDFPVKLDVPPDKIITVWFAETGTPLGNGEVLLSDNCVSPLSRVDKERENDSICLPAPTNQRALFELLALFDPKSGMYKLLRRLDFGGWTARHARDATFGSLGMSPADSDDKLSLVVPDYFNDLLCSDDFQRAIIPLVLEAYGDKRRLLFVHIPKCAGTDLTQHLRMRYPSLEQQIMAPHLTNKKELFRQLQKFAELTRFFDAVFVRGHIPLNYYLANHLGRPADRLFSIVRDPIEIALSTANYVMMRIRQDLDRQQLLRDTEQWLDFLGIEALPNEMSNDFVAHVCMKVLYEKKIVVPNSMCHWLGGGDAKAVLERLAEHHVEVTDTVRYNHWLLDRWGITSTSRYNESIKFVTAETLRPNDRDYLREISKEDIKLYGALQNSLTAAGRGWVIGPEVLAA